MLYKALVLKMQKNDLPPNLDELINAVFKSKSKSKRSKKDENSDKFLLSMIALIIFTIWAISGLFIVKAAEQGVIQRFGEFNRIVGPGLHWIPKIMDTVQLVNISKIYGYEYRANMLTADENIVDVELNVQYRIDNPKNFLFNATNPIDSVNQSTASALRQIIGESSLDQILTTGRHKVRDDVFDQLSDILSIYNIGIEITDVRLQAARPPQSVKEAFDDAVKAREDEQRYINEALAYAEKVIPIAEGKAERLIKESEGYRDQLVLQASAQTAIYNSLVDEYIANPKVIETAVYYRTMEQVLAKTSKVILNTDKGSNSMIYLPLDQLIKKSMSREHSANFGINNDNFSDVNDVSDPQKQLTNYASLSKKPYGTMRTYR